MANSMGFFVLKILRSAESGENRIQQSGCESKKSVFCSSIFLDDLKSDSLNGFFQLRLVAFVGEVFTFTHSFQHRKPPVQKKKVPLIDL